MLSKSDLMWIIGFYEGEGTAFCVRLKAHGYKTWKLYAGVTQKEKPILTWIQKKLGFGRIESISHGRFTWHRLDFQSAQARRFLKLVIPYLKSGKKRLQAKRALKKDHRYVKPR